MDHFNYRDGHLQAEGVDVADIATQVGTPCYVYSRATLERHWRAFDAALELRQIMQASGLPGGLISMASSSVLFMVRSMPPVYVAVTWMLVQAVG